MMDRRKQAGRTALALGGGAALLIAGLALAAQPGATSPAGTTSAQAEEWPMPKGHGQDTTQGQQLVWVKRDGATLRSGTRRTDPEIATLKRGDQLVVLAKGIRLRVRTATGIEGYIPAMDVSDTKPRTSLGEVAVASNDNLSPNERSNVSSIRGLNPVAEQYATTEKVPQEAVDDAKKMETISEGIDRSSLDEFAEEGKKGEE